MGPVQPPASKPPSGSSPACPGPWMTPSNDMYSMTMSLLISKSSAPEEFDQGWCDRGGLDIVLLPCEGAPAPIRERRGHDVRARAEPGRLAAIKHQRGNPDSGELVAAQRVVAHEGGVVNRGVSHGLLSRPPRRLAHLGDELSGHANRVGEEELDHVAAATLRQARLELCFVVGADLRPAAVDDEGRLPNRQLLHLRAGRGARRVQGEHARS